jgi:hypothetical protein
MFTTTQSSFLGTNKRTREEVSSECLPDAKKPKVSVESMIASLHAVANKSQEKFNRIETINQVTAGRGTISRTGRSIRERNTINTFQYVFKNRLSIQA